MEKKVIDKGEMGSGTLYVLLILFATIALGFELIGAKFPSALSTTNGQQVVVDTTDPNSKGNKNSLQLYTFSGHPPSTTPGQLVQSSLCIAANTPITGNTKKGSRWESEILAGYSPNNGQTVGNSGKIKVWVADEEAPMIAPGEIVDNTTGNVITPGDRTAKADDGYLWEPALYIAPNLAESASPQPHFPIVILGEINNHPPALSGGRFAHPQIETPPPGVTLSPFASNNYFAEYIWDVASLGLGPGTYQAEFVIHDGDEDRGVGCVSISIQ